MHSYGLADDEAIADEFSDGLTGVGVGNLVNLIGVEPNLALSASDDGRREALLGTEVDPRRIELAPKFLEFDVFCASCVVCVGLLGEICCACVDDRPSRHRLLNPRSPAN